MNQMKKDCGITKVMLKSLLRFFCLIKRGQIYYKCLIKRCSEVMCALGKFLVYDCYSDYRSS